MFTHVIRAALLIGVAGLVASLLAAPAAAEWSGGTECDPTQESCEVSAGLEESEPESPGDAPAEADESGGGGSDAEDALAGWDCKYKIIDTDTDSDPQAGDRPSPDHQLVMKNCTDPETGTSIQERTWVAPGNGDVPIDPAALAQEAIDRLRLPQPQIASSPANYQLVRLPTWLYLGGDSWQAQSASASVPGLTVTATARPIKATWDMGDGSTVVCEGAGTKWTPKYSAKESSPDCGHTYTRSSAHRPGGTYAVSVVVDWEVTWSGGGQSGTEPVMTTAAQASWPVAESQTAVK